MKYLILLAFVLASCLSVSTDPAPANPLDTLGVDTATVDTLQIDTLLPND